MQTDPNWSNFLYDAESDKVSLYLPNVKIDKVSQRYVKKWPDHILSPIGIKAQLGNCSDKSTGFR